MSSFPVFFSKYSGQQFHALPLNLNICDAFNRCPSTIRSHHFAVANARDNRKFGFAEDKCELFVAFSAINFRKCCKSINAFESTYQKCIIQ